MTNNTASSFLVVNVDHSSSRKVWGVNATIIAFRYQSPSPRTSTLPHTPLFCITDTTKMNTESAETQHTARRRRQNGRMAQRTPQSPRCLHSTRRSRKTYHGRGRTPFAPQIADDKAKKTVLVYGHFDLSACELRSFDFHLCNIPSTYTGVAGI